MKQVEVIIIGQGIAGTIAAIELLKKKIDFIIVDEGHAHTASFTAGAVLNNYHLRQDRPIHRYQQTFEKAIGYYIALEKELGIPLIESKPIIQLSQHGTKKLVHWHIPYRQVTEGYTYFLNARYLLSHMRDLLDQKGRLVEAHWSLQDTTADEAGVVWNRYQARYLVLCEGAAARNNPVLASQKWNKNKGDALILSIPGLDQGYIYQLGEQRLVPLGNEQFWLGTQHIWEFDELEADRHWAEIQLEQLGKVLALPFEPMAHLYAERPTTPGQEPILRFIDEYDRVAVINGLGSKGFIRAATLIPDFIQNELFGSTRNN